MWFKRRHTLGAGTSPPSEQSECVQHQPSREARKALQEARAAQIGAEHRKIESEPLLQEVRRLLRENDITKTIQRFVPGSAS